MNKAFELDWQFIKLFKFIKDRDELEATKQVLKRHFPAIKEIFMNQICSEKFYPVITWMEFSNAVQMWDIIGSDRGDLTLQDMDRAFVATNYEEVELDNNDDNSLCRYELMEIIVRLAKMKFMDKGDYESFAEATQSERPKSLRPHIKVQYGRAAQAIEGSWRSGRWPRSCHLDTHWLRGYAVVPADAWR